MWFAAVALCFLCLNSDILGTVQAHNDEYITQTIMEIRNKCTNMGSKLPSEEDWKKIERHEMPSDEAFCFLNCVFEVAGIITNNRFTPELAVAKMPVHLQQNAIVKTVVEQCPNEVQHDNNKCKLAENIYHCLYIYRKIAPLEPNLRSMLRQMLKYQIECMKTNKASQEDLRRIENEEVPLQREGKCLIACVLSKEEIISNNKFDLNGALKVFQPVFNQTIINELRKCDREVEQNSDQCELGANIFTCLNKYTPKLKDMIENSQMSTGQNTGMYGSNNYNNNNGYSTYEESTTYNYNNYRG